MRKLTKQILHNFFLITLNFYSDDFRVFFRAVILLALHE